MPGQKPSHARVLAVLSEVGRAMRRLDLMAAASVGPDTLAAMIAAGVVECIHGRSPDKRGVVNTHAWFRVAGSNAPLPADVVLDLSLREIGELRRRVLAHLAEHGETRSKDLQRHNVGGSTLWSMTDDHLIQRRKDGVKTSYSITDEGRAALSSGFCARKRATRERRGKCTRCGEAKDVGLFRGELLCGVCLVGVDEPIAVPSGYSCALGWDE